MKKRTAILLAVFMLSISSYVGIPYMKYFNPVPEVSAALLKPGSTVGFAVRRFGTSKGGLFVKEVKKGSGPGVADEVTYAEKANIHEIVMAIIAADLPTRGLSTLTLNKSTVDALSNDYYNLAQSIFLVGEQRDLRPRTR